LSNLANPFADISSVVATKCTIFDNISHTTNIAFFTATNGSLIIKSIIKCIYSFSGILFAINFLIGALAYILCFYKSYGLYILDQGLRDLESGKPPEDGEMCHCQHWKRSTSFS